MLGCKNLTRFVSSLRRDPHPVYVLNYTGCLERQAFRASHGVTLVRVVLPTRFVPSGMFTPKLPLGDGRTSQPRCAERLTLFNRSTHARGVCLTMALASHRVGLVVLEYETLNVKHQLGTRLPAVVRLRIAAPANEVTRSLPLLITVLQDTPHVEASSTVRVQSEGVGFRTISFWDIVPEYYQYKDNILISNYFITN